MYRNANIHNSFGFRGEQIKIVKVFDNNGEWDEFGGYLGLEIKNIKSFMVRFTFRRKN